MANLNLSPTAKHALIAPTLQQLFTPTDASGYIESINYFVLRRMEQKKLNNDDNIHLYNLLNLIQSLSKLEDLK